MLKRKDPEGVSNLCSAGFTLMSVAVFINHDSKSEPICMDGSLHFAVWRNPESSGVSLLRKAIKEKGSYHVGRLIQAGAVELICVSNLSFCE